MAIAETAPYSFIGQVHEGDVCEGIDDFGKVDTGVVVLNLG
jgi:hypothetical protein